MFLTAATGTTPAAPGSAGRPGAAAHAHGRPDGDRPTSRRSSPLEISVTGGTLGDVTVVDGGGAAVHGAVAAVTGQPGSVVWTPEAQLAYGTKYTLTATADERRRQGGEGVHHLHHGHPDHAVDAVASARWTA